MEYLPPPPTDSSGSHDQATDLVIPHATTDLVPFLHEHPLIPFTSFVHDWCKACNSSNGSCVYIYGGYRCNELGCGDVVFHKDCVKPLQEINHYSHPDHSLKLIFQDSEVSTCCSICEISFKVGYRCSVCDFKLDLLCARRPEPLVLPANSFGHEHPLQLRRIFVVNQEISNAFHVYRCHHCKFAIQVDSVDLFSEAYHSSHSQHPLKSLKSQVPHYADKKCLLCAAELDKGYDLFQGSINFNGGFRENSDEDFYQVHHCDVCNFSICRACMRDPPPVTTKCPTTHEHQLHLVPRRVNFTCNACGTRGDRSPYFCLECNFMIHRQCIGLPRVININRHDHRISYTRRIGHGEWKCRVCREKVNGFYGGYTCTKCPNLVVHSLCATSDDVWDMVEREGTPEEEEIAPPFEVIDDYTIKHFSHDHNLRINEDGQILPESKLCVACVFQICSEPFYSCKQCDFVLHEKCANLPRKTRHVLSNLPFTLQTTACEKVDRCGLCFRHFTGFRYKSGLYKTIDVRCISTSDLLEHKSHEHPLYYHSYSSYAAPCCGRCGEHDGLAFGCSECKYFLDGKCALLPEKVMKKRYDDHPLFLCFGDKNASGEYWCEACETKLDPKDWFYTCTECGVVLHVSCVVGDYSYINAGSITRSDEEVVSNNSICRPLCFVCKSRCKLPSVLKLSEDCVYFCSYKCRESCTLLKR